MSSGLFFVGAFFLATILVGAPLLLLLYAIRRHRHEASRDRPTLPYLAAGVAAALILAFNSLVAMMTSVASFSGGTNLSWAHAVGLSGAWFCFWAWVGMMVLLRRRSRSMV